MKIDMHVHTSEISACGKLAAKEVVRLYKEAGYDAICVTNHFSSYTVKHLAKQGKFDFVKAYHEGYELAKAEGEKVGLKVFIGYELRVNECDNDYLVYDMNDYLLENFPKLLDLPTKEFCQVVRKNGILLFQAHPFRNNMKIVNPDYLDGIEVFNGHPGQVSRNQMAEAWADFHPQLRRISGSDCHETHHVGRGGVITERNIETQSDLLEMLRDGDYTIYHV